MVGSGYATNLQEMYGLRVPTISTSSEKAAAAPSIGVTDRILMMETPSTQWHRRRLRGYFVEGRRARRPKPPKQASQPRTSWSWASSTK